MTADALRRSPAPLALAVFLLLFAVAVSVRAALAACDGHLVYALDDAYIHMAMGRTVAESGTWGLTPGQPAFASSSPGWTLLLAASCAVGLTGAWVPLALNVAAGVALLSVVDAEARRLLATDRARAWLLASLVFTTPMPALVLSGMEALLQCALMAAFVATVARAQATEPDARERRVALGLALLAAASCAVRYESAFVVVAAAALLAARGRWQLVAAATAGAVAPMAAYALFGASHGGWLVPTSIVLKGEPPDLRSLASIVAFLSDKGLPALHAQPPMAPLLVVLLVIVVALAGRGRDMGGQAGGWVWIACGAILLHVHLVSYEWLYRYKAYLVALALPACAFGLSRAWRAFGLSAAFVCRPVSRCVAFLLLAAILAAPLAAGAVDALSRGIRGSRSIYLQQFQVARFLAGEGTSPVVVNDIGAVAYFARRPVVDLLGLATQEIATRRRTRTMTTADIDAQARAAGARVAVLYAQRFYGPIALPRTWRCVASWTSAESATVAHDTVTWCATSASGAPALEAELEAFAPRLPMGVTTRREPRAGS